MSLGNCLVVGINGTIGAALFSRLQLSSATVWGTTHKHQNEKYPTHIFYLNLLDEPSTWDFAGITFDTVYLCAGVCRMSLCEDDPTATYHVNVTQMQALIRRLTAMGAFIVFLSTNQVFSGNHPFELATAAYQPINEYGHQKVALEKWIKSHCKRFAIVRLTKVVEKHMSLVKNWIDQLTNNLSVHAFHDMILAPVSLRQVIDVLVILGQKKQPGYYHVSGKEDISYYHLASYLAHCLKRHPSLVQSVSALNAGIKKNFLPQFTTLDCASTITLSGETPPHFSDVIHECFDILIESN